jgi:hypothetical protein
VRPSASHAVVSAQAFHASPPRFRRHRPRDDAPADRVVDDGRERGFRVRIVSHEIARHVAQPREANGADAAFASRRSRASLACADRSPRLVVPHHELVREPRAQSRWSPPRRQVADRAINPIRGQGHRHTPLHVAP